MGRRAGSSAWVEKARSTEVSLARLGTDYLDHYLLHWPNGVNGFAGVVKAFENLRAAGKIRAWGVSNFTVRDMERLFRVSEWRPLRDARSGKFGPPSEPAAKRSFAARQLCDTNP